MLYTPETNMLLYINYISIKKVFLRVQDGLKIPYENNAQQQCDTMVKIKVLKSIFKLRFLN